MKAFAGLLDRLSFQPRRLGKLRLIEDYFATTPDPDRGYALAVMTRGLTFRHAKPALIRGLVNERVDPVLFELSYDYVGDLAETVALIWPTPTEAPAPPPSLGEVVTRLRDTGKAALPGLLAGWLDALDVTGRWALIKLMTGGLRIGVSARLAKTAFAGFGNLAVDDVEEIWHGQAPPYEALFAWAESRGGRPAVRAAGGFRPVMLAQALDEAGLSDLDASAYLAEWKWDGIRVQLSAGDGVVLLYTRAVYDIGGGFPDLLAAVDFGAVLDGELLVIRDGAVAPFGDLQKRLNRKTVSGRLQRAFPVGVRLYDILFDGGDDLRDLPLGDRRERLEAWFAARRPAGFDLSPLVPFDDWPTLAELRRAPPVDGVEGLMLKRRDSVYVAGRPKGPWFKWKRDPLLADAVLMYARRGHGKRSSYYSDYTFGVWRGDELVPVGKAYCGFTDAELVELDRWVRNNTINRFGPVREVSRGLVLEVAFDGVRESGRHKSGLALRLPRINRIRWDKPVAEADAIEALLSRLPC